MEGFGFRSIGWIESPLKGAEGNIEFLVHFSRIHENSAEWSLLAWKERLRIMPGPHGWIMFHVKSTRTLQKQESMVLMYVNYIQLFFFFFPRIESTRNARRDAITPSPMTLIMWFSRTCYSWFVFVFRVMLVRSPVCQAQCILHLSDVNLALLLWRQLTMCSIYNLMHVISCRKTTALQL